MPIVTINMLKGRTLEQKKTLVKKITEVVGDTLNSEPNKVRVIIHEINDENYAVGGELKSETKILAKN